MIHGDIEVQFSWSRLVCVLAIVGVASCGAKQLSFFGPDAGGSRDGIPPMGSSGLAGGAPGGLGGDTNAASPCERTTSQALGILQTYCSGCHTADPNTQMGIPGFNVLDIGTLLANVWAITTDPVTMMPFRLLVPGQPDRSAIYVRIANGSMPKQPTDIRSSRNPVPTVSDLSVLRSWITSCLGACADGDDWTCNDAPAISSIWGTCRAGACVCTSPFELNPGTGRCRAPTVGGAGGSGGGSICGAIVTVDAGLPPSLWPGDDACTGDQLPIVGTWVGYVENMTFPSGSDALRMTVRAANATRVCGSVTLGSGAPPPPITDANVGYPLGLIRCAGDGGPRYFNRDVSSFDSFPMTMIDGRVTGPRLQFQATVDEMWRPWCELQTSYLVAPDIYACIPPAGACPGPSPDCGKERLCDGSMYSGGPCRCTAGGCTADPMALSGAGGHLTFDLRINGTSADGSVNLGNPGLHNMHLDRAP